MTEKDFLLNEILVVIYMDILVSSNENAYLGVYTNFKGGNKNYKNKSWPPIFTNIH